MITKLIDTGDRTAINVNGFENQKNRVVMVSQQLLRMMQERGVLADHCVDRVTQDSFVVGEFDRDGISVIEEFIFVRWQHHMVLAHINGLLSLDACVIIWYDYVSLKIVF